MSSLSCVSGEIVLRKGALLDHMFIVAKGMSLCGEVCSVVVYDFLLLF